MSEIMSCPFCSGEMAITPDLRGLTVACPHCGREISVPDSEAFVQEPRTSSRIRYRYVPDYKGLGIVAVLFFWPIGMFAIMQNAEAKRKRAAGDHESARRSAEKARRTGILAIIVGIAASVFYFLFEIMRR